MSQLQAESKKCFELCGAKVKKVKTAQYRRAQLSHITEASSRFGINEFRPTNAAFFAQFVDFEIGKVHDTLLEGEDDVFNIQTLQPQAVNNVQSEFIDSIAYISVIGDDVAIVQGKSIRIDQLEKYLNWLLFEKRSQKGTLAFDVPVPTEAQNAMASKKASVLVIGTPVSIVPKSLGSKTYELGDGLGSAVLKAISNRFEKNFRLTQVLDKEVLDVVLRIKFKGKKRLQGAERELMDTMLSATRNIPDDQLSIEMEGGGRLTGSDLRLKLNINVSVDPVTKRIDETELQDEMKTWLQSLIRSKIVN